MTEKAMAAVEDSAAWKSFVRLLHRGHDPQGSTNSTGDLLSSFTHSSHLSRFYAACPLPFSVVPG
jgi:hypothetical protein